MLRVCAMAVVLFASLVLGGERQSSVSASANPATRAMLVVPASNVSWTAPLLDDRHIVYGYTIPRVHPLPCASCGAPAFSGFRVHMYVRTYRQHAGVLSVSEARPLFVGPRGKEVIGQSLAGGWLVYTTDTQADGWTLYARNVDTGQALLLDSPEREGIPSRFLHADTDGRTVVWQSTTRGHGQYASVIRSYTFATRQRRLLDKAVESGGYWDGDPHISGSYLLFNRYGDRAETKPTSRLFVENLTTRRVWPLTRSGQWDGEPSLSGNVVAWVHGLGSLGHRHGLVVANLATGHRVALPHSSAQLPRVVDGRYVVFRPDYATFYPRGNVQVYDTATGERRRVIWGQDAKGFAPGVDVQVGGRAVLVPLTRPCHAPYGLCPQHYALLPVAAR